MSAISGNGGVVVITIGTVAATFDNTSWTVNPNALLANVTNSATGIGSKYLAIRQDPTWEASAPLDSAQLPETLLLSDGLDLTKVFFKRGAVTSGERCTDTTLQDISVVKDEMDAMRITLRGQGGYVVHGTTN